jgi:two-component system, cell cycle response regulator
LSARVLVVDDNRPNLDLMLYLLRAFGYEAEGASDGLAGLQAMGRSPFDIALVDILMPGIDGFEFLRRIRESAKHAMTPVIAVTALAMAGDREKIVGAGFDGYIPKPIDPQTFVGSVETHLPVWLHSGVRPSAIAAKEGSPRRSSAGPLLLVVDDVGENVELTRAALRPFGYQIVDARSVDEALELVKRIRPAVVLCDLHMPRRSGFDLLTEIRSGPATRDTPFLFISSTSWHEADRRRGMKLGAQRFLVRPIDPERLHREIEECVKS